MSHSPIDDEDIGPGEDLDFSASVARSAVCSPGRYSLYATQDVWWTKGTDDSEVTASSESGHYLKAGTYWFVRINQADKGSRDQIIALRDSVNGTLRISKCSRVGG